MPGEEMKKEPKEAKERKKGNNYRKTNEIIKEINKQSNKRTINKQKPINRKTNQRNKETKKHTNQQKHKQAKQPTNKQKQRTIEETQQATSIRLCAMWKQHPQTNRNLPRRWGFLRLAFFRCFSVLFLPGSTGKSNPHNPARNFTCE